MNTDSFLLFLPQLCDFMAKSTRKKRETAVDGLSTKDFVIIKGARMHNLKNVDVAIPRSQFTVITGLSGSGKSSLAFDTIYAEGQRRAERRGDEAPGIDADHLRQHAGDHDDQHDDDRRGHVGKAAQ